jgi:hypothetical protein
MEERGHGRKREKERKLARERAWVILQVRSGALTAKEGAMKQPAQTIRELAWRIALESWLRSKGYIKVYINQKCHPILPPLLAHE